MPSGESGQHTLFLRPSHRRIRQLAGEIARMHEEAAGEYAEILVQIGDRLREASAELEASDWRHWVADQLPFSRAAAYNYMGLSTFAEERPADFERLKSLGSSKLYAIAALDGAAIRLLRKRKLHPIPGTERSETLQRMSVPELYRLVASLQRPLSEDRPIGRVMSGYRLRVRGLLRATEELAERRDDLDPEAVDELHRTLLAAAETLEAIFALTR